MLRVQVKKGSIYRRSSEMNSVRQTDKIFSAENGNIAQRRKCNRTWHQKYTV